MRDSVNPIYTEIKSDQKEYKIAFHCKMRHLPVVMDHSVFASLNSKITYSAMALISYELNSAKINIEKFNQHISFGLEPGHTAIIGLSGDCCISKCKLPIRFGLPCKCWLYQGVIDQIPILISIIYSRWFYKGPPFVVSWKMSFDLNIIVDQNIFVGLAKQENTLWGRGFIYWRRKKSIRFSAPRNNLGVWILSSFFYTNSSKRWSVLTE